MAGSLISMEPQPRARVYVDRGGAIVSVIITNAPVDFSMPCDLSVLIFEPRWRVEVVDIHSEAVVEADWVGRFPFPRD